MDKMHTDSLPTGATSIPPAARRAANKRFIIPLEMRTILLPDPYISLKQLADFTLPAVKVVTSSTSEPSNTIFFSKEEPSVINSSLISKLRYLPTPDESTIRRLVVEGCKAWVGGSKSIRYVHLAHGEATTSFPLWVITFWNEVVVEEGFKIDDEGRVVRVAEVESAEAGEEAAAEPEPVGRGHQKKKATVPWGGVAIWECHD